MTHTRQDVHTTIPLARRHSAHCKRTVRRPGPYKKSTLHGTKRNKTWREHPTRKPETKQLAGQEKHVSVVHAVRTNAGGVSAGVATQFVSKAFHGPPTLNTELQHLLQSHCHRNYGRRTTDKVTLRRTPCLRTCV